MDKHSRKDSNRLLKRQDGVVAVEFVILFPLFMLIIVGIVEIGHLFYVRHTLTNASREGARAAVVYVPGSETAREQWARLKAKEMVDNYLTPFLPAESWSIDKDTDITVTLVTLPSGTTTLVGGTLKVDVHANSPLLLLDKLVTAFEDIALVAETTMRFE